MLGRYVKKMNAPHRIALIGLSALMVASCVSRLEPESFNKLPKPSGMYGGSRLYDPWVYRGSDARGNHFTYSWNENNIVRDRNLIAPTETVVTGDRMDLTNDSKAWRVARPILTPAGTLKSFRIVSPVWDRLDRRPIFADEEPNT